MADYKLYVSEKIDKLVTDTNAFTDAVKAGDIDKAKALYARPASSTRRSSRSPNCSATSTAPIDSRADDHEQKEKDPDFTGFHRIEYALFGRTRRRPGPRGRQAVPTSSSSRSAIADLTLPPEKVVGGAAVLIEEVASTKISGEEDRYSHTDLWDFQANIDGARKIVAWSSRWSRRKTGLHQERQRRISPPSTPSWRSTRRPTVIETYDKLSDADRKALAGPVTALAEDLSKLRGTLGLN
ncbi:MAG: imelysin family protein [Solirubrobacterales bacterium]